MPLTISIACSLVTGIFSFILGWLGHKEKISNILRHIPDNATIPELRKRL